MSKREVKMIQSTTIAEEAKIMKSTHLLQTNSSDRSKAESSEKI